MADNCNAAASGRMCRRKNRYDAFFAFIQQFLPRNHPFLIFFLFCLQFRDFLLELLLHLGELVPLPCKMGIERRIRVVQTVFCDFALRIVIIGQFRAGLRLRLFDRIDQQSLRQ